MLSHLECPSGARHVSHVKQAPRRNPSEFYSTWQWWFVSVNEVPFALLILAWVMHMVNSEFYTVEPRSYVSLGTAGKKHSWETVTTRKSQTEIAPQIATATSKMALGGCQFSCYMAGRSYCDWEWHVCVRIRDAYSVPWQWPLSTLYALHPNILHMRHRITQLYCSGAD